MAHRGGSLEEAENTIEAFSRCKSLNIKNIELDLRETKDK